MSVIRVYMETERHLPLKYTYKRLAYDIAYS
jgi:hypothetical protein